MKKVCILLLSIFTLPALASGIDSNTNSAPCTNNTLETYSGNTNLQADWAPNTINLRWYNGNTQITPTNTVANTCTYDGSLTIPSNEPSRTGYTFAGWTVVPEYDFSTISASIPGIYAWSRGIAYCWYGTSAQTTTVPCDNGDFDDLNSYEWKSSFDYGTVYGFGLCSSTVGTTRGEIGTPNESSDGVYCWCRATGFIPTNGNVKYAPKKSAKYVFAKILNNSNGHCHTNCADYCSYYCVGGSSFSYSL